MTLFAGLYFGQIHHAIIMAMKNAWPQADPNYQIVSVQKFGDEMEPMRLLTLKNDAITLPMTAIVMESTWHEAQMNGPQLVCSATIKLVQREIDDEEEGILIILDQNSPYFIPKKDLKPS